MRTKMKWDPKSEDEIKNEDFQRNVRNSTKCFRETLQYKIVEQCVTEFNLSIID